MDRTLLDSLRQRYKAGEKVTRLAKEAGVPWQRLWGMLQESGNQPPRQRQEQPRRQQRGFIPRPQASGITRYEFDSVGEAIKDALTDYAQNEHNRSMLARKSARHLSGSDRWGNYYTREKLLSAIGNPPEHLVAAVNEMREQIMDDIKPPTTPRRKVRRGQEFGDELDSDRWLVRDLAPWDRNVREQHPQRTMTIGVNLTVHCGQSESDLLYRGAAAVALADVLTSRGLNVEIVAFWSISHMTNECRFVVGKYTVKRADMPLDLGAVTTALCEIAFARMVALYTLARHVPGHMNDGMGVCEELPSEDRRGLDFYVDTNVRSRETADAWVAGAIAREEAQVTHA